MAQHKPQKVWVRFDMEESPMMVSLHGENVSELVVAALHLAHKNVSPGLVSVTFDMNDVRPGAPLSDYVSLTSDDRPLLLNINVPEPEGKLKIE